MNKTLLKLQIGPVQEFIAQARSTRDLWSGSYLLSWLMASGIKALGKLVAAQGESPLAGASRAVVYPALSDQPLVRFMCEGKRSGETGAHFALLTPNLPNILVAYVPDDRAKEIAAGVEASIRSEWNRISDTCWTACLREGFVGSEQTEQFQAQRDRFLHIAWQLCPIPKDCRQAANIGAERGEVEKWCAAFRSGNAHALHYALCSWQLDATRQCREFRAWRVCGWTVAENCNKDSLTGREETLLGGARWWDAQFSEEKRRERRERDPSNLWDILVRERHRNDRLGAVTLVKRLWHWHFLHGVHGLSARHRKEQSLGKTEFPFPSTFHIATHKPWSNCEDDEREPDEETGRLANYFAVLAFDGDEIGKWVGGAKFAVGLTEFQHRDFSVRLAAFALRCVRPIVDACDGRLIYAGGDDVLALLPADTAIDCATFLRAAYRADAGLPAGIAALAKSLAQRYREPDLDSGLSPHRRLASEGRLFADWAALCEKLPGSVPGTAGHGYPEASVGVAIAHYKHPLQDVVRQAQAAEKRAKRNLGRAALAVTLLKRSGETVEWGCQWESRGLDLLGCLAKGRRRNTISARFPYRLVSLLSAYAGDARVDVVDFPVQKVIQAEFTHVLNQQQGPNFDQGFATDALLALRMHMEKTAGQPVQTQLASHIGLCQTLAFTQSDGTGQAVADACVGGMDA